ncbi:hypothetical protein [Deinococcus planocerae]|uniref:hypothetical protein n=1 Tax=Deinococcus planocerae TaxID=1737569 RepID=UPI0011AFD0B6|nr:hypothetical protein [Deinococcus planocerae]
MTAPVVGALAGNVLRHLRVTVDYRNGRLAVVPARTACGDDLHALGLTVRQTGGRSFVQAVAESAHEHTRQEVEVGDEVLTAGGTDLRDRNLTEVVEALCAREGTAIELRLGREGETRRRHLTTVALL